MEISIFISALFIGLAGSFHCAGMCGPLMLTALFNNSNNTVSIKKWMIYHFGRISIYVIWGMLFGLIGTSLKLFGWQQNISISIGIMCIVGVLVLKIFPRIETHIGNFYLVRFLKEKLIYQESQHQNNHLLLNGMINGILPCGLVYIGMAGAAGMQHPLYGGLFMLFFGFGTIPILLLVFLMGKKIISPVRKYAIAFYPYMIILVGVLLIIRGLNLGIYYSPTLVKNGTGHIVCSPK